MKINVKNIIIILLGVGILTAACSKMNDLHDKYMKGGETIYISKFDSLKIYPGKRQVQFVYWLSDPKAKHVEILWSLRQKSERRDISITTPDNPGIFTLDNLDEGSISFEMFNYDANYQEKSIVARYTVSIYGSIYESSLNNRTIRTYTLDANDNKMVINWVSSTYENSVGTEIKYTTTSGVKIDTIAKPGVLFNNVTELNNIVNDSEFSFRTLYKPSATALDIFSTAVTSFSVIANKWTEPFKTHSLSAAEPCTLHVFDYDIGFLSGSAASFGITYNTTRTAGSAAGINYRTNGGDASGTRLNFEGGTPVGTPPDGNIGSIGVGDWFIYTINVEDAGNYGVTAKTSSTSATGRLRLEIDGVSAGVVSLPNTGALATYATTDFPNTLDLTQGKHRIRLYVEATSFNMRNLEFTHQP